MRVYKRILIAFYWSLFYLCLTVSLMAISWDLCVLFLRLTNARELGRLWSLTIVVAPLWSVTTVVYYHCGPWPLWSHHCGHLDNMVFWLLWSVPIVVTLLWSLPHCGQPLWSMTIVVAQLWSMTFVVTCQPWHFSLAAVVTWPLWSAGVHF